MEDSMSGDNIGALVGKIYDLVKDLPPEDISRVFGAVSTLFGGAVTTAAPATAPSQVPGQITSNIVAASSESMDIRSFIQSKDPKNDVQLAAAIAYFYAFEAPAAQRKDSINSTDLTEAIRLTNKKRPPRPSQVLNNAKMLGLLDSAGERGHFKINSVGENLVAMVLPGNGTKSSASKGKKIKKVSKTATKSRRRK
jgi:hypothetical protein